MTITPIRYGAESDLLGFALARRQSKYHKALDGRKRPIRGLWVRSGNYPFPHVP
jgi:hypothetical protein